MFKSRKVLLKTLYHVVMEVEEFSPDTSDLTCPTMRGKKANKPAAGAGGVVWDERH